MTNDDLRIVADDLQFLSEWGEEITDREIRHGSAVLRRLLVEDVYGHAWRGTGNTKQPRLIAVNLSPVATPDNISHIEFALAAGAEFRGMQIACMLKNVGRQSFGTLMFPARENGYPGEYEFPLSNYLSSLSGVVDGEPFTRRDVIKYIANVKGGVHLSSKRRRAEKELVARLGKIEKRMTIHTTDGLLVELVAIGQAVGGSKDASKFIDYVQNEL